MKYRHTMLRISNLEESLDFYVGRIGLVETARYEVAQGRFTLVFLTAPNDPDAQIELTYNWDPEVLTVGRNFGHISYDVENIYETCTRLMERGVVLARRRAMATWRSCEVPTMCRSSSSRRANG